MHFLISHQLDKCIIHLHLFQALLLLPCMLLVDLLGEQLASLVCVHEILAELVTFLTEAVKRPSHYSGLSLKLKIDEWCDCACIQFTCIVSSPAWTVG